MNPNIHILSTRALSRSSVTKAAEAGIIIDVEPFIRVRAVDDMLLKENIRQLSGKPLTVIFTSEQAVSSVFSQISIQPQWRIFCISGATKTAVSALMPESAIIATADYGAELATKILSEKATTRDLCFFCGNKRLNTIPEALRAAAIPFQEFVVYKTELRARKISRHYDGILFYSPSAVESFFSLNNIPEDTILFSIGKTTGKALKNHTGNRVIICETPDTDLLINQIINFNFKQRISSRL